MNYRQFEAAIAAATLEPAPRAALITKLNAEIRLPPRPDATLTNPLPPATPSAP
jgi:hypothetical protein